MTSFLPMPAPMYERGAMIELHRAVEQRVETLTPGAGRYTPVMTSSGGGETLTYTTQLGQWVRMGNLLWVAAEIVLATKSGGSGDIQVSLPAMAAGIARQGLSVYIDSMAAGWTGAPMALINASGSAVLVRELTAGAAATAWTHLGATGAVRVTGWYSVA